MSAKNYWERLSALNLQSLQCRRERYIIIHTWKIINGLVPNDIPLEFRESKRLGTRAIVPSLNKNATRSALSTHDNSFAVRAAKLWNILPKHLQTNDSLDTFKVSLSTFLKNIKDRPPVNGYTTANHNSLLD